MRISTLMARRRSQLGRRAARGAAGAAGAAAGARKGAGRARAARAGKTAGRARAAEDAGPRRLDRRVGAAAAALRFQPRRRRLRAARQQYRPGRVLLRARRRLGLRGGAGGPRRARKEIARLQRRGRRAQAGGRRACARRRRCRRRRRRRPVPPPAAKNDEFSRNLHEGHRARPRLSANAPGSALVEMVGGFQKDVLPTANHARPICPPSAQRCAAAHRQRELAPRHAGRRLHRDHRARPRDFIEQSGAGDGALLVYLRHTSASLDHPGERRSRRAGRSCRRARPAGAGGRALDPRRRGPRRHAGARQGAC